VTIQPADRNSLRASDADRQRVADVLSSAYADGRLSMDEFSDRNDKVWAAKTLGELVPVTLDLGGPVAAVVPVGRGMVSVANVQPVHSIAVFSARSQPEHWVVPSTVSALAFMGAAEFDFRKATFTSPRVELSVGVIMGSVKLQVPDGVTVIDRTVCVMGSVEVKKLTPAKPGAPVIELTGFVFMGSVEVRGANHASLAAKLGFGR